MTEPTSTQHSDVALFPLPRAVLLPHQLLPLHVFEQRYRQLVADALKSGRMIGVPMLKPGFEADYEGAPAIEPYLGVGRIVTHRQLPDGRFYIVLRGLMRARAVSETQQRPYRLATVEEVPDVQSTHNLRSLQEQVAGLATRVTSFLPTSRRTLLEQAAQLAEGADSADYLMAELLEEPGERQALLEERDPLLRLTRLLELLSALSDALPEQPDGVTGPAYWN